MRTLQKLLRIITASALVFNYSLSAALPIFAQEISTDSLEIPTFESQVADATLGLPIIVDTQNSDIEIKATPTPNSSPALESITPENSTSDESTSRETIKAPALTADLSSADNSPPVTDPILSPVFQPSASLATDKSDYSPTEKATIIGTNLLPFQKYTLEITSLENYFFSTEVVTNESGSFTYEYQLDGTYRPDYKVELKDASGSVILSTTFTDTQDKVTICHATDSQSNPYVTNEPAKSGDVDGHDGHNGSVWYPGIPDHSWGDIIPPFNYTGGSYPGKNWDTAGRAIWNNSCNIPPQTGTITIIKDSQPNDSRNFTFTRSFGGSFVLDDDSDNTYPNTKTFNDLQSGSYTVSENSTSGWVLSNITCVDPTQNSTTSGSTATINLAAGEVVTCTFTNTKLGKIEGEKFNDLNGNGHDDWGESDLPGWKIFIDENDNGQYDDGELYDNTNSDGDFSFSSLVPDTYKVCEVMQSGWINTKPICQTTTVTAGDTDTIDFGNKQQPKGSIKVEKDVVPNDSSSWPFRITGSDYNQTFNLTDNHSNTKSNLVAGSYTVSETDSSNYTTTYDCGSKGSGSGTSVTFNLDWGQNVTCKFTNTKIQYGSITVCKVIADSEDNVVDGSQFPGANFSISGLNVSTSQGSPAGIIGQSDFSTPLSFNENIFSSIEGDDAECITYSELPMGNYYYGEESIPASSWESPKYNDQFNNPVNSLSDFYSYSGELFDSNDENDGQRNTNADGHIVLSELRPNRTLVILNQYKPLVGSISGTKWNDLNGNGNWDEGEPVVTHTDIPGGVTIFLDDGNYEFEDEMRTTTQDDGSYSFSNLPPGTYTVCEIEPLGWTNTSPDGNGCHEATVYPGQDSAGYNFGNFKLGEIRGRKFVDENGDGYKQGSERFAAGWTINLYKDNGNGKFNPDNDQYVGSSTTGDFGNKMYRFDGLDVGLYFVTEEVKDGWSQTRPLKLTGKTFYRVKINSGDIKYRRFGNFHEGEIFGMKWEDIDGDGEKDEGENGIKNWKISLCRYEQSGQDDRLLTNLDDPDDNGSDDEDSEEDENSENDSEVCVAVSDVLTDENGNYQFLGLEPGDYKVWEEDREGWEHTTASSQDVSISGDPRSENNRVEVNFGNQELPVNFEISKSNNAVTVQSRGSVVTYTITLKNPNKRTVYNISVSDSLPAGFTYVSGSWTSSNGSPEPDYSANPGIWQVGDIGPEETVTLTYDVRIGDSVQAGSHCNLASASGCQKDGECKERIFATALDPGTITDSENIVSSCVDISVGQSFGGLFNGEVQGAVLGISTETGSNLLYIILSLFSTLILGICLSLYPVRFPKGWLKVLPVIAALVIFAGNFSPVSAQGVTVVQLSTLTGATNNTDIKLSYNVLDLNNAATSVRAYYKRPKDGGFSDLGQSFTAKTGEISVQSIITSDDGTYEFYVVAQGTDPNIESNHVSTKLDRSTPGGPENYSKDRVGAGTYKISWRTPDDSSINRVIIWKSEKINFDANDATKVAEVATSAKQEQSYFDNVPIDKSYFYVLKTVDEAGNASGFVGDSVTVNQTSSTSTTGDSQALGGQGNQGQILAESTESASPSPAVSNGEENPEAGGISSQFSNWKIAAIGFAGLAFVSTLWFFARKKR